VEALLWLGPALLLAAANVRLRDTAHLVGLVLLPLFYATPVFYDAGALSAVPWVRWLNPMVWIIDAHRDALLRQQWPPVAPLAATTAVGVVALLIGLRVYRARMGRFLEHL
jgi:lipopolysaccharide transport system permease protein